MSNTAFITGTSRGIGKETVRVFAENGWNVVAHARKHTINFEEHIARLSEACHVEIMPLYFDMLDANSMKEGIKDIKKRKVKINALINNAGVADGGLFQMTSISTVKDIFNINLFAQMELTQLVLRIMADENASIINVASAAGVNIRSGNTAYGVSKAALIAWTKVLQIELNGRLRVNAIAPGLTDTDMADVMEEKLAAKTLSRVSSNAIAKPEEIAKVIYFLASDSARHISGEVIKVDGGSGI